MSWLTGRDMAASDETASILVTGGAGFVGAYVIRDLLRAGAHVVLLDTAPNSAILDRVLTSEHPGRLSRSTGDLLDGWSLLRLCRRHSVEQIVHLAAPLTQVVRSSPGAGLTAMCAGTANVLEVAGALDVRRVVWASSTAVFGRVDAGQPLTERSPRCPESLYGSCKVLCEDLAAAYREDHGVDSIGLRLGVLYGAWRERGWIASFGQDEDPVRSALTGRPIVVREPDRRLDWLYVEDAAALVCRALAAPATQDHVFNTSGEVATRRQFSEHIARHVPSVDIAIEDGEPTANHHAATTGNEVMFDDGALRSQIGYASRRSLSDGIADTVRLYRASGMSPGDVTAHV